MEEIKVGEYIRTIDGYIRKVTQVNKKGTYEGICYGAYSVDKPYKNSQGISAKKIKSHSKDIIDLIEVGDYVNGYKVEKINDGFIYCCESNGYYKEIIWKEKDIKTIVTKEQFENISYRLEE